MIDDIFNREIVLENERALLRPLEESDFGNLLPFSLREPEIWKYGLVSAAGPENLRTYIEEAVNNRAQKKEYPFIVFDKKAGAFAGSTRFYDIQQQYASTQLGFTWYGKDFQRTGLNRHCKWLLLSFAFESWGLERVEFRADVNNEASILAMKAIGCVEEGVLRNHMPTADGRRRSSIVLSILKSDWMQGGREFLRGKTR
ncbi:MAG TPA: GNAT family protein [Chitinophagaceae bacterium]|nr:GNAT family protein [Chitinophagaceae bacterium]